MYDILDVSHKSNDVMYSLHQIFRLNYPPAYPYFYLGANIDTSKLYKVTVNWYQSINDYLKNVVRVLDERLVSYGRQTLSKKKIPSLPISTILEYKYHWNVMMILPTTIRI